MRELPLVWRLGLVAIAVAALVFVAWKSAASKDDWMGEHLAEFLGAVASAAALAFIAYAANIQARQARSQELLNAYDLARGDLGAQARTIAITARLVVEEKKGGGQGKLEVYQRAYDAGDRTAFAQLIIQPRRIIEAFDGEAGKRLKHQALRYIAIFDSVAALTQEQALESVLFRLPLGRAYCVLKIALQDDRSGRLAGFLKLSPDPEPMLSEDQP
ncbi:hypothetical protein [Caulobacter sp. BE254]|uniref:hypothetical protein n=1 Tax=Caulobacter sp. BE254 TaxID=2817720 RepID=UPI0028558B56|nr:hypothetical protein [Caulobacter sp. BE254]MDR7118151.1 hypothetical protein [Caulobacter sp. BE254]